MFRSQETSPVGDRKLRAPREHGEILAVPALWEAQNLAQWNARQLDSADVRIGDQSLREFRAWCRQDCLDRARHWTARLLATDVDASREGLLFVTGHQPQLAHAGVWVKNLAVAHLAQRSQGIGLNLIVDNDTVSHQTVLVPGGTFAQPHLEGVPFDRPSPQQPWEELLLEDLELFHSFAERTTTHLRPWGIEPILTSMWPDAVECSRRTLSTASCLSVCRMRQERRWGMDNLELPVSEMCRSEPFCEFAAHLIRHVERFHACYNAAVRAYRVTNRVRNDRHPVPDLDRRGDRYELPFRYWRPGEWTRRPVFASRDGTGRMMLFAEDQQLFSAAANESLAAALAEIQDSGRFRTRALTTTLFARLGLGDLFIHGIGGAKYDEITDQLMVDFFQSPVPSFLTLTATLRLPLGMHSATADDVRKLSRRLRDLQFNPERVIDRPRIEELIAIKQELIREQQSARTSGLNHRERVSRRGDNRRRHLRFKQVREALAPFAAECLAETRTQLRKAQQQVQANATLQSREYPAVLFPEPMLRDVVERLAGRIED